MNIQELFEGIKKIFEPFLQERAISEVDEWNGSASNYSSTDEYCSACLIDVNSAAGRDTKAQSYCMLPVKPPGSNKMADKAIMAAAGGRGITQVKKPDDVPQEAWDSALKKAAKTIVSAYKEMDREAPESVMEISRALSMGDVFGKTWEASQRKYPAAYLHDIYAESDGSLFAILSQDGRLYRSPLSIQDNELTLQDWTEVVQEFVPVGRTKTQIIRQLDGQVRWFSVSATSVLNRDREIDSRDLFDSFITYAEKTGNYPYRTFYHLGEQFRTGQADFLGRDGNCYITSGLYDKSESAELEIRAIEKEPDYWGESIGYLPTSPPKFIDINGIKIPVYRAGINVEISNLPEKEASGLFTVTKMEVNRMLTGKQWEAFVKKFEGDEEKARQWLEENTEVTNRAIDDMKLITRNQQEEGEPVTEEEASPQVEVDEAVLSEVVRQVTESESFTGFGEQLNDIAEAIEALNGATDKLRTQLEGLQQDVNGRLETLERSKTVERQEWTNDLPAKSVVRVGLKQPRFAPDNPVLITSTDKATETLNKLPKI